MVNEKAFEWQQLESEQPVLFSMALGANAEHVMNDYGRGGLVTEERIQIPDYADRLPAEIGRFTQQTVYDDSNPPSIVPARRWPWWFSSSSGPRVCRSILEDRTPVPSDIDGAYWTGVGNLRSPICHGRWRGKTCACFRIEIFFRIHKFNRTAVFPCLEGNTAVFYCLFFTPISPIGWVAT